MKKTSLTLCAAMMIATPSHARASNYVVELMQTDESTIETIGRVPPKRFIELDLGSLRTRPAMLPGGTIDLKERMRIRAERAMERQREVTNARRDWGPSEKNDNAKSGSGSRPTVNEPPRNIVIE